MLRVAQTGRASKVGADACRCINNGVMAPDWSTFDHSMEHVLPISTCYDLPTIIDGTLGCKSDGMDRQDYSLQAQQRLHFH